MKGLLIKDFKLLKGQCKMMLIILFLALAIVLTGVEYATFGIAFPMYVLSTFVISTISYDEFDNGDTFLFSLPFDRKTYVYEKYIFGVLLGGSIWLFTSVITTVYQMYHIEDFAMQDWIISVFLLFMFLVIFLSLVLPPVIKHGSEKGRIIMFLIFGGLSILGFVLAHLTFFSDCISWLSSLSLPVLIILAMCICIFILIISIQISVKIIKQKEF